MVDLIKWLAKKKKKRWKTTEWKEIKRKGKNKEGRRGGQTEDTNS